MKKSIFYSLVSISACTFIHIVAVKYFSSEVALKNKEIDDVFFTFISKGNKECKMLGSE